MLNYQFKNAPLGMLFGYLTKIYLGVITAKLSGSGIDRYFYILVMIDEAQEPFTQQKLADHIKVDKTLMVRIVDYLSERGFVKRKVNKDDKREQFIISTSKAKKIIPLIKKNIAEVNDSALKNFTKKEKEVFYKNLTDICGNLEALPAESIELDFKKK